MEWGEAGELTHTKGFATRDIYLHLQTQSVQYSLISQLQLSKCCAEETALVSVNILPTGSSPYIFI